MTISYRKFNPGIQWDLESAMFHAWTAPDGELWLCFHRTSDGYLLRFPGLADFCVSADGGEVRCFPALDLSEETVQHLYLNQVLPLALSRQGGLVFHASAVDLHGSGIAFMGASGRGKSTLAAAFATARFAFLTDDGLSLLRCGGTYHIQPSHPSIRLWQDSRAALLSPRTPPAPGAQNSSKSRFLTGADIPYCEEPRPLRRVYFLGEGKVDEVEILPMKPGQALIELIKHSFLLDIEEKEMLAAHFNELANLVREPIYYRLDYPRRYGDLERVRQAIIEHVGNTGNAS